MPSSTTERTATLNNKLNDPHYYRLPEQPRLPSSTTETTIAELDNGEDRQARQPRQLYDIDEGDFARGEDESLADYFLRHQESARQWEYYRQFKLEPEEAKKAFQEYGFEEDCETELRLLFEEEDRKKQIQDAEEDSKEPQKQAPSGGT